MNRKLHPAPFAAIAILMALMALGLGAQTEPPAAKKQDEKPAAKAADAPSRPAVLMCTTVLHLDPGRAGPKPAKPPIRIRVRYRAVPLSADTLEAIRANPRARAFYNGRVLRRLARFANDVPVQVGKTTLRPSTYDAGFVCLSKGRWHFVVLDRDGEAAATAPLAVSGGESEIRCLNLSLVPGREPGRFTLAVRYGKLRGTLGMTTVVEEKEENKG